jgi:hypothetical protein
MLDMIHNRAQKGGAEDDALTETNDREWLRKPTTRYKDFWPADATQILKY